MKLLNRFFAIVFIIALAPLFLLAQTDSTASGGLGGVISKIPEWVPIVIMGLYELLARVVPTSKNWSILTLVMNVIKFIFPNKSSQPPLIVKNVETGVNVPVYTHDIPKP
jgi:hypothetical protein